MSIRPPRSVRVDDVLALEGSEKWSLRYLPKRLELWLRTVLPLPSDSRIGFDWTTRSLKLAFDEPFEPAACARHAR